MGKKVVIIGLDGGTLDVIRPMIQNGELPNLAATMSEGSSGELLSVIPPCTPPAWTSFMTGKNPDKHGVFAFRHHTFDPLDRATRWVNTNYIRSRTIWDLLGDKKVIAINVPLTYPTFKVDGIMISGFMTPPKGVEDYIYPQDIADVVHEVAKGYKLDIPLRAYNLSPDRILDELLDVEERRIEVATHLIQSHPWDMFMTVFNITDKAAHLFWENGGNGISGGKTLQKVYKKVDEMIGRLLSKIQEEYTLFVVSDHGTGPHKGLFITNKFLMDRGFLVLKRPTWPKFYKQYTLKVRTRYRFLRIPRLLKNVTPEMIDWSKTRAYGENYGIYVNLKGRGPWGSVEDHEYDEVRERIIDHLCQLKDPQTGKRLVDNAYKREEVYPGPFADNFPDILFVVKDYSVLVDDRWYFKNYFTRSRLLGTHTKEGVICIKGEGIKKGFQIKGARIIDVLPTVLYMLGLPIPDDLDGRLLEGCFENDAILLSPPEFEEAKPFVKESEQEFVLSRDEEEDLKERLAALGYIE